MRKNVKETPWKYLGFVSMETKSLFAKFCFESNEEGCIDFHQSFFLTWQRDLYIFVADNTAVAAVNLLPKQKCHRYLAIIFRFFMFYFTVLCKLFVLLCYICALESNDVSKVSP